jgi:hypothetical protein
VVRLSKDPVSKDPVSKDPVSKDPVSKDPCVQPGQIDVRYHRFGLNDVVGLPREPNRRARVSTSA